jgi:hypothetical protein
MAANPSAKKLFALIMFTVLVSIYMIGSEPSLFAVLSSPWHDRRLRETLNTAAGKRISFDFRHHTVTEKNESDSLATLIINALSNSHYSRESRW